MKPKGSQTPETGATCARCARASFPQNGRLGICRAFQYMVAKESAICEVYRYIDVPRKASKDSSRAANKRPSSGGGTA